MEYKERFYSFYKELCEVGYQVIQTQDLNSSNIDEHFYSIINILKDGIETDEVKKMMIHVIFQDGIDIDLTIFDYAINLMFWQLNVQINKPVESIHLVFFDNITKGAIKDYIDNLFVDIYRKDIPFMQMNQMIDSVIGKFRDLQPFQLYLANTLNLKDTIDLMNKYPDFNESVHFDINGIPLEDVKDAGMDAARVQINYIKNSDHCLRDSFRTGEAISPKQFKEVAVNIGSKPDGLGSVFPHPIPNSFMNGGLQTPEDICIESSVGRVAQILQKTNVGTSGAFARKLELNNQDTKLHDDSNYVCDTRNFEEVTIDSMTKLAMYDLRYYRDNPDGIDRLLDYKKSKDLIGRKLYFRSPMTCASAARGQGICYKCYGDLAYANQEVNVGQIAAESLSSIYTQILLSAKHLLESLVIKMTWVPEFQEYFELSFNTFSLKGDVNFKGYRLLIDEDIKAEEDIDEVAYNYYINSFQIVKPDGEKIKIKTSESDNIYFSPDLLDIYYKMPVDSVDDGQELVYIDMESLKDLPVLFIMEVKNNELSATMNKIKTLIDNKTVISSYDRNSILEEFINTNIAGNIKLNAVHFEVLLMNQIRDSEDDIEMPNWSVPNAQYQIFPLSKALSNNRSIAIRLQTNEISRVLLSPQNRYLNKPSINDLFYMEQPQEYLEADIISDDYEVDKEDKKKDIEQPLSFDNPKIRVGRQIHKRTVIKQ